MFLLVYPGASWVILMITDALDHALSLPEWVRPLEVLVLLAGMVVVQAVAWVHALFRLKIEDGVLRLERRAG